MVLNGEPMPFPTWRSTDFGHFSKWIISYEQDFNFKVEKLLMMNQLWTLHPKLVQFHSILAKKKPSDIFHFIKKLFFCEFIDS